jgi:hypothetical protein
MRAALITFTAVAVIAACAAAGYALGSTKAPDAADAQSARHGAYEAAYAKAFARSRRASLVRGTRVGLEKGKAAGTADGSALGDRHGGDAADAELAAQQAAATPEPSTTPAGGLTYVPNLPSGQPGYALPEDQRTLRCVGYDAQTGQCVGD